MMERVKGAMTRAIKSVSDLKDRSNDGSRFYLPLGYQALKLKLSDILNGCLGNSPLMGDPQFDSMLSWARGKLDSEFK